MAKLAEGAGAPKRFYEKAEAVKAGDIYEIRLDDRAAKTPKRHILAAREAKLAQAVAAEWEAVEGRIDTGVMPLTKLLTTAIDLGPHEEAAWRQTVTGFLSSDLLCYRAHMPEALVRRQEEVWAPYLDWWADDFGVALKVTSGVIAVDQPAAALAAADAYLAALCHARLLAVKSATEITGSAVLALALCEGHASADEIFAASRLDENFQEERWGVDGEAKERSEILRRDFASIARFLDLLAAA